MTKEWQNVFQGCKTFQFYFQCLSFYKISHKSNWSWGSSVNQHQHHSCLHFLHSIMNLFWSACPSLALILFKLQYCCNVNHDGHAFMRHRLHSAFNSWWETLSVQVHFRNVLDVSVCFWDSVGIKTLLDGCNQLLRDMHIEVKCAVVPPVVSTALLRSPSLNIKELHILALSAL